MNFGIPVVSNKTQQIPKTFYCIKNLILHTFVFITWFSPALEFFDLQKFSFVKNQRTSNFN